MNKQRNVRGKKVEKESKDPTGNMRTVTGEFITGRKAVQPNQEEIL